MKEGRGGIRGNTQRKKVGNELDQIVVDLGAETWSETSDNPLLKAGAAVSSSAGAGKVVSAGTSVDAGAGAGPVVQPASKWSLWGKSAPDKAKETPSAAESAPAPPAETLTPKPASLAGEAE